MEFELRPCLTGIAVRRRAGVDRCGEGSVAATQKNHRSGLRTISARNGNRNTEALRAVLMLLDAGMTVTVGLTKPDDE